MATKKLFGLFLAKISIDIKIAYGIIRSTKLNQKGGKMKNENGEGTGISYVIMPIDILQDKNLTCSEKILYCYLSLFKKGVCFQSNDKLAEMTGLDDSTIKRGLKKLSEMNYVFIEFLNNNSAQRRIYVIFDNPKKLAYLTRKGMFSLDKKDDPEPVLKVEVPKAEYKEGTRPKREQFSSDAEFEQAFYKWNSV